MVYRKGFARDGDARRCCNTPTAPTACRWTRILGGASEPARPRLRLRDRARARRPGDGPRVVRRRPAAQQEKLVHRLHRRHPRSGRASAMRARQGVCDGRQRRRPADRGGREPRAATTTAASSPRCRSSTWSRPCSDDGIPLTTNEYDEWGDPRERGVLPIHAVLFALRQRARAGLPGDARDHGPMGQPGAVLRAGQMGREAARAEDRRAIRCCCTSRWRPDTAASRAASSAIAKPRWSTRSCSGCCKGLEGKIGAARQRRARWRGGGSTMQGCAFAFSRLQIARARAADNSSTCKR